MFLGDATKGRLVVVPEMSLEVADDSTNVHLNNPVF